MSALPSTVSVVVCTHNRADSLRRTLRALEFLDHGNLEVVIVNGPSTDGTDAVLEEYAGRIKVGRCANRNLSEARNIGIALSAGEVVAFIDDDAYPDPAWLDRLLDGYDRDEVVGVGGPVYDHTGARLQVRYSVANRYGEARTVDGANPTELLCSPHTLEFPYLIGTNSSFRRSALAGIGGFDEAFDYYLDETDVCLRLIDRGDVVRCLDDGFVYHKFLPSEVRTADRAIRDRYSVLRSTCYFALKHGRPYGSFAEVCTRLSGIVEAHRRDYRANVEHGLLTAADLDRFERDVLRAMDDGFERARRPAGHAPPGRLAGPPPFLPFPVRRPAEHRLHLCFLSQEWPPMQLNGIARVIHTLATGLAGAGHVVHVLTRGEDHDRVDLEDGVWVHRVTVTRHEPPADIPVPQHVWNYSASMLGELRRIDAHRRVDLVQMPNWDSEGVAVLLDGGFTTVLGLYTPLRTVRIVDPTFARDDPILDQLVALEELAYRQVDGLLACGPSIVEEIEDRYRLTLRRDRLGFVAHGLPDAGRDRASADAAADPSTVTVLFVGRLEARKGIDTLLACLPAVMEREPRLRVVVAGNDRLPAEDGLTHRERFERSEAGRRLAGRVRFLGIVPDDELRRLYASCDVLVAPSRYESFGLILLEAMMQGKPVIAGRVGGMTEIVEEGGNGHLVEPGDAGALGDAILRLAGSAELRERFGRRSRELFVERFSMERMVEGANRYYDTLLGRSTAAWEAPAAARAATAAVPDAGAAAAPGAPQRRGGDSRAATQPDAAAPVTTEPPPDGEAPPTDEPPPDAVPAASPPRRQRHRFFPATGHWTARLLTHTVCPVCHLHLQVLPQAVTADGRVKSGQLWCERCRAIAAAIDAFKVDFHQRGQARILLPEPARLPHLGEQRVGPGHRDLQVHGRWMPHGPWLRSEGRSLADVLEYRGRFTDATVRLLTHPSSGVVDIYVDGALAASNDLYRDAGSVVVGIPVARDLPFGEHTVTVRPRGTRSPAARGSEVLFEEIVLLGPVDAGAGFTEPWPINRGNPYSTVIERYLDARGDGDGFVLEVGGGDRRSARRGHVNFEYLPFELADVYGDIHSLPFADGTFALTFSQAVFEHVANPFDAAAEVIRVTRPGGLIITEVAFMQPLHAVPYHFFNHTLWGAEELFRSCEIVESDWFGELSFTVDWLIKSVDLPAKVPAERIDRIVSELKAMDALVSHDELKPAASGVYVVARKPPAPS